MVIILDFDSPILFFNYSCSLPFWVWCSLISITWLFRSLTNFSKNVFKSPTTLWILCLRNILLLKLTVSLLWFMLISMNLNARRAKWKKTVWVFTKIEDELFRVKGTMFGFIDLFRHLNRIQFLNIILFKN